MFIFNCVFDGKKKNQNNGSANELQSDTATDSSDTVIETTWHNAAPATSNKRSTTFQTDTS